MKPVEKKDDGAEIGYMLLNDYSNKGIGTEAVKQIAPYAFKVLSLKQIFRPVRLKTFRTFCNEAQNNNNTK